MEGFAVNPRDFAKLKAEMIDTFEESLQMLLDAYQRFTDLEQNTDDEAQAEGTPKKLKYDSVISSCGCMALLRLDMLPYYTSGFL